MQKYDLNSKRIRSGEIAIIYLSNGLSKLGNKIDVYNNNKNYCIINDVKYFNLGNTNKNFLLYRLQSEHN